VSDILEGFIQFGFGCLLFSVAGLFATVPFACDTHNSYWEARSAWIIQNPEALPKLKAMNDMARVGYFVDAQIAIEQNQKKADEAAKKD